MLSCRLFPRLVIATAVASAVLVPATAVPIDRTASPVVEVKVAKHLKWSYSVIKIPAHLNQEASFPPEMMTMASDVTVAYDGKPAPHSVTLAYGPECVVRQNPTDFDITSLNDSCSNQIYLNGGKPGNKRFRTTIAVTSGGVSANVTITSGSDISIGPRRVSPGQPWVVNTKMIWTGVEVNYAPDTTATSGATISIVSPLFGR
jgi:hypothetical protein